MSDKIQRIEEHLAAVGEADDFDDLNSILEGIREERRENRANRPHRCGGGFGEGPPAGETT